MHIRYLSKNHLQKPKAKIKKEEVKILSVQLEKEYERFEKITEQNLASPKEAVKQASSQYLHINEQINALNKGLIQRRSRLIESAMLPTP